MCTSRSWFAYMSSIQQVGLKLNIYLLLLVMVKHFSKIRICSSGLSFTEHMRRVLFGTNCLSETQFFHLLHLSMVIFVGAEPQRYSCTKSHKLYSQTWLKDATKAQFISNKNRKSKSASPSPMLKLPFVAFHP